MEERLPPPPKAKLNAEKGVSQLDVIGAKKKQVEFKKSITVVKEAKVLSPR